MPNAPVKQLRHVYLNTTLTAAELQALLANFGQQQDLLTVGYEGTLVDGEKSASDGKQTGVMILVAPTYEEWG